ncbi:hypothetical protein B4144_3326 [Bacillus atrophaeus]|nr:hypothetical protein B4144_3326 [Bacillus atrophaeus]
MLYSLTDKRADAKKRLYIGGQLMDSHDNREWGISFGTSSRRVSSILV